MPTPAPECGAATRPVTASPDAGSRSTLTGANQSGESICASGGIRSAAIRAIAPARFTRP